jgi:hypothetical protein
MVWVVCQGQGEQSPRVESCWYRNMLKCHWYLRKTEFKASYGWLEGFRKRWQIVFNESCGDTSDVNSETTEEWGLNFRPKLRDMNLKTWWTVIDWTLLPGASREIAMSEKWKMPGRKTLKRKIDCFPMWFCVWWSGETVSDQQGSKAMMLVKDRHTETFHWVEIRQKGVDEDTDHGGVVDGLQWQKDSALTSMGRGRKCRVNT